MKIQRHLYLMVFLSMALVFQALAYTGSRQLEKQLQELINQVKPAFVFFDQGSGVVISADGLVLTNSHVLLQPLQTFDVRLGNGRSYKADVLGRDRFGDLALLKLRGNVEFPHVPLADAKTLKIGQRCIALGNPFAVGLLDQTPTVTIGVISALHQLHGRYTDAIVTDVPINPGNSGGPLINLQGELLGINGKIEPRLGLRSNTGLAYAIPVNQIQQFLPVLKNAGGKDVYHGWLFGLAFEEDGDVVGAEIRQISPESDAAVIGFLPGDVITAVNGQKVWSPQRFMGIVGTYPGETPMEVLLNRKDNAEAIVLKFNLKTLRLGELYFTLRESRPGDRFLTVSMVEPDSPAARAGLRTGDQILSLFGTDMATHQLGMQFLILQNIMVQLRPGSRVILKVRRPGSEGKPEDEIIDYHAG